MPKRRAKTELVRGVNPDCDEVNEQLSEESDPEPPKERKIYKAVRRFAIKPSNTEANSFKNFTGFNFSKQSMESPDPPIQEITPKTDNSSKKEEMMARVKKLNADFIEFLKLYYSEATPVDLRPTLRDYIRHFDSIERDFSCTLPSDHQHVVDTPSMEQPKITRGKLALNELFNSSTRSNIEVPKMSPYPEPSVQLHCDKVVTTLASFSTLFSMPTTSLDHTNMFSLHHLSSQPPTCIQSTNPLGQPPTCPQSTNPFGQPPTCIQSTNPLGQPPTCIQSTNPLGQPPTCIQSTNPLGQPPMCIQSTNPFGQPPTCIQSTNPCFPSIFSQPTACVSNPFSLVNSTYKLPEMPYVNPFANLQQPVKEDDFDDIPDNVVIEDPDSEESIFSGQCVLYFLEDSNWTKKGVGKVYVQKNGQSHVFMRTEAATGLLLLNTVLSTKSKMEMKSSKRVFFVSTLGGQLKSTLLSFTNEEDATKFSDAVKSCFD